MRTFTLILIAVLIAAIPGVNEWMQYDRGAIAAGHLWRLVTGHLAHWGADHFLWDAMVLAVLGLIGERISVKRFWIAVIGSAIAGSMVMWWFMPSVELYRGLSGVDCGLGGMVGVMVLSEAMANRNGWRVSMLVIVFAGFCAKCVYEMTTGQTVFVDSGAAGFVSLAGIHLVGAGVGVVSGLGCGMGRSFVVGEPGC